MRKQFGAFPAQQFARLLSPGAIEVAVPQQTFHRDLFDLSVNCHLPSTKTAPAGGLPCGRLGDAQRFVIAAVRVQALRLICRCLRFSHHLPRA